MKKRSPPCPRAKILQKMWPPCPRVKKILVPSPPHCPLKIPDLQGINSVASLKCSPSEVQTLHVRPLTTKFAGTRTISEGAGASVGACIRFVNPGPSDLYGNIPVTTFRKAGFLEARRGRAINACYIGAKHSGRILLCLNFGHIVGEKLISTI